MGSLEESEARTALQPARGCPRAVCVQTPAQPHGATVRFTVFKSGEKEANAAASTAPPGPVAVGADPTGAPRLFRAPAPCAPRVRPCPGGPPQAARLHHPPSLSTEGRDGPRRAAPSRGGLAGDGGSHAGARPRRRGGPGRGGGAPAPSLPSGRGGGGRGGGGAAGASPALPPSLPRPRAARCGRAPCASAARLPPPRAPAAPSPRTRRAVSGERPWRGRGGEEARRPMRAGRPAGLRRARAEASRARARPAPTMRRLRRLAHLVLFCPFSKGLQVGAPRPGRLPAPSPLPPWGPAAAGSRGIQPGDPGRIPDSRSRAWVRGPWGTGGRRGPGWMPLIG